MRSNIKEFKLDNGYKIVSYLYYWSIRYYADLIDPLGDIVFRSPGKKQRQSALDLAEERYQKIILTKKHPHLV